LARSQTVDAKGHYEAALRARQLEAWRAHQGRRRAQQTEESGLTKHFLINGEMTMQMKTSGLLSVLLVAACATSVPVPDNLKPAASESLKRVISAKGVQIYECRDQKWVFVAPEADLFDSRGNLVGKHYAGPRWEATGDGSRIIGAVKSRADAPAAGAIPWLLLDTKSEGGNGYFSDVTSIQRVATVGGVAPAATCTEAGSQARVPYTADYYFFHAR
jgi:hypothetical protein